MFEELEQEEREERESRKRLMRDSALVIGGLAVLGALAYFIWRPSAKPAPNPQQATAQTVPAEPPNATRDLEIIKAVMGKDVTGIRVMWSVKIRNRSTRYTYSNIKYEASFVGPDGRTLSASADTIHDSVGPGDMKTIPQFVDGLYNSNASTYNFKLVGADATNP